MDNKLLVQKAEEFLKTTFENSKWMQENVADKNYRLEHSFRVANIARQIGTSEGLDADALYIGGILHDIAYCEEETVKDWINHGRRSAELARPFLEEIGMDDNFIEEICYGIAIHVDDKSDFPGERTSFALSIGAADNIDRFDVYRIYESLQYAKFSDMPLNEKLKFLDKKLDSIERAIRYIKEEPCNETADKMLNAKIEYQKEFFVKLKEQLEKSY